MDNIIIRPLESGDRDRLPPLLKALDEFHHDRQPDLFRTPEEMHQKRLEKDIFSRYSNGSIQGFIALDGEQAVGLVTGVIRPMDSIITKTRTVGFVNELIVLEPHRGTPLATRLMEQIEKHLVEQGAEELGLSVVSINHRALSFYKRLGYNPQTFQMSKPVAHLNTEITKDKSCE
ncbi:GNAT family N-acetyltransferase [Parendozoicomonas haliclonae]|nr:GNAT family N-acetyltransferase [Parendozoicomonas haliclonae]